MFYKKQQKQYLSATLKVNTFLNCYFNYYINSLFKCAAVYHTCKAHHNIIKEYVIS